MNIYTDKLIDFYTLNDLDSDENENRLLEFFQKKSRNDFDNDFNKERRRIEIFRREIDVAKHEDNKKQIIHYLTHLEGFKNKIDDKKDFYQFVLKTTYYQNWNESQQKHFKETSQKLLEWKDFFFSYTRHKEYGAEDYNNKYKGLIEKINYKCANTNCKDWREENMLAHAIVKEITKIMGLNGFYDKWDIESGAEIKNIINSFCSKTFCLIQLIQEGLLTLHPEDNWAYYEYELFCEKHGEKKKEFSSDLQKNIDNRFHYIITGNNIHNVKWFWDKNVTFA